MYGYFQVKFKRHTNGMSNQWIEPINNDKVWYEKVIWKITPPELIHRGRYTDITGSFKFDESI